MSTAASVIADLRKKSRETTRKTFIRHGMPPDRVLGVNVGDLKPIAKQIKGQQELAYELFDSGFVDARYLAGMVADGSQMTEKQLDAWANDSAQMGLISEYTLPWVTVENPHARELPMKWIASKKEHVACAGWCTYSGIVATTDDDALDLKEIEALLKDIAKKVHSAQNRVKYTMNGFVIAVGTYVRPLMKEAMAAARKIGIVSVNMGDTACKAPLAVEYIEKNEAAGRAGRKEKTIRC